jgi:hypothetical protein
MQTSACRAPAACPQHRSRSGIDILLAMSLAHRFRYRRQTSPYEIIASPSAVHVSTQDVLVQQLPCQAPSWLAPDD